MLKCKSIIVGLETSLESVFGLDGSEFGWQHIPDCWSSKRKRSFGKLGSSTWFDERVTMISANENKHGYNTWIYTVMQ